MSTKLLLLADVEDLGRSGDVVVVKPGYARNYLLPKRIAVVADKGALRMQERLQEERKKKALQDKKEAEEIAAKLEGGTISATVKTDQDGHMYGSVSAVDIIHLLQEQYGVVVEKRSVLLKSPIKKTGTFSVDLRFKEEVTASVTLKVASEDEAREQGNGAEETPKE